MVAIRSIETLLWRNRLADHPVVVVNVNAGSPATWNASPEIRALLNERLPALRLGVVDHTVTGVLAAWCLSFQQERFDVPPVVGADETRFWFAALDHVLAHVAVSGAARLLNQMIATPGLTSQQAAEAFAWLEGQCEPVALDQSVRAMIATATARNIPWFRLGPESRDVQLGQGHKQARLRETLVSSESGLAMSHVSDKATTCGLLAAVGLPVGRFARAQNADQAAAAADRIGYPVVLKPTHGGKGRGVVVGLANRDAVHQAAERLLKATPQILVQSFIHGNDHRLLVVAGRLIAAARRDPAAVTGDGRRTVEELVRVANTDPRRGKGFSRIMNLIEIDAETQRVLARQGLTLASIPAAGTVVRLRATANISTGGTAVDVTDVIHPDNARLAVRAARTVGLTVAGVDFLSPDIARSWHDVGGGICEINSTVGLRPHWIADPARDVVGPILDTIYAPGEDGRIPTILVTGSKGKTTTTRMIDRILRAAGHVVGSATTDGVTIDGEVVTRGDVAGPSGASLVLREPTVTAAALETARGGVIRRGIYLDRCDAAALTNVGDDQVGIDGIDTVDDMASLKRKVIDTATRVVVLNAEDSRCLAIARTFSVERVILFALNPSAEGLSDHVAAGGTVVTLAHEGGVETIVIRRAGGDARVVRVDDLPSVLGGILRHNIANAMTAVGLAHGLAIDTVAMKHGLCSYTSSLADAQGRFTQVEGFPVAIVFERAISVPALAVSMPAIDRLPVEGSRSCMLTAQGDRADRHYGAVAAAIAGHFDRYICFERDDWRRGRDPGELQNRLKDGLLAAGVGEDAIVMAGAEPDAMRIAAEHALGAGGLLAVLGTNIDKSLPALRAAFATLGKSQAPVA